MIDTTHSLYPLANEYSLKLKVCGHPLRFNILCLIEKQDACVTDLWRCLNESQPVISQHLAVLKKNNIVECSIKGNKRIYRITDDYVREIIRCFIRILQSKCIS